MIKSMTESIQLLNRNANATAIALIDIVGGGWRSQNRVELRIVTYESAVPITHMSTSPQEGETPFQIARSILLLLMI